MADQNDFYRQIENLEQEERKKARKEKWAKREKNFWKTFLFTENGKPKSGLMVYTFCLSFVFLGLYIGAFYLVIEMLTEPLSGLPPFWSNLLQSLAVGLLGVALSGLVHFLLSDKRLAFGTHLWLALYVVACIITLSIMLGEWEAIAAMLTFACWFAVIPVLMGLIATYLLYRRDYRPAAAAAEEEPEWKKYIRRR